jgi:hypothetical protein
MMPFEQTITVPVPVDRHIHLDFDLPETWTGSEVRVAFFPEDSDVVLEQDKRELYTHILEGIADAEAGRVGTWEDFNARLDTRASAGSSQTSSSWTRACRTTW